MKISCMGCGYVGLVAGTCLADMGNEVICFDIDKGKINKLEKGIIPIYEPGLKDMLERNIKEKRLHFSNGIKTAIKESNVIFITVGTPPGKNLAGLFEQSSTIMFLNWDITNGKVSKSITLNRSDRALGSRRLLAPWQFRIQFLQDQSGWLVYGTAFLDRNKDTLSAVVTAPRRSFRAPNRLIDGQRVLRMSDDLSKLSSVKLSKN